MRTVAHGPRPSRSGLRSCDHPDSQVQPPDDFPHPARVASCGFQVRLDQVDWVGADYASLWLEEPKTLQAFRTLLSSYRFFGVPEEETLERLLAQSAEDQQEVTDQLGYQVRQAVEVLVHTIDRANRDSSGALLKGCPRTGFTKPP
jgi:hypothetical protein